MCHLFAYGALRRLPRNGALARDPAGPVDTLFDPEARLTNPEEWFLQRDYAANNPRNTPAQREAAAAARDLLVRALTGQLLPDVSVLEPVTRDARSGATELHAHTPFGRVRVADLGLGYQSTLAWVVDLAARMVAAYPDAPNPLAMPAVCLVDEIDLHLHPRWQRTLLRELSRHFPNVQFVVTAHSPLIVQAAPEANVAVLRRDGDRVVIDNDPTVVRNWRVDQVLTSDLFGLEGARAPEVDRLVARRDRLLAKPTLTPADEVAIRELDARIGDLPQGESPEQQEAMALILRAAKELRAPHAAASGKAVAKGRRR
ncbi:MAG: AAA family ATPase [Polyangiales bacterium]